MQVAMILKEHRPAVFELDDPKPLVLGILDQIKDFLPGITDQELQLFLKWWCRRTSYLAAVSKEGSYRYHLNGCRGTKVTDKHRQFAAEFLQRRSAQKDE